MSSELLSVEGLSVAFDVGSERVVAVDAVSYELRAGEVLAVVGESGSGKTTHALAALRLLPTESSAHVSGIVRYAGQDLFGLDTKRLRAIRHSHIAMVSQDPYATLDPMFSIEGHFRELRGEREGRTESRFRVLEILTQVGLDDPRTYLKARPHELSGGTAQRIALGLALWVAPRILFADEPTSALDPIVQAQMLRAIRDFVQSSGGSVVFITHNIALAGSLADRVAVMYGGKIVEIGPTEDVLGSPLHPYSAGLLRSRPSMRLRPHRLHVLPGEPPNPAALPSGCAFHPRCPLSEDRCSQESPPLASYEGQRAARCWMAGVGP